MISHISSDDGIQKYVTHEVTMWKFNTPFTAPFGSRCEADSKLNISVLYSVILVFISELVRNNLNKCKRLR